ncbi:uncharacterized membrane protein HdeD (DUF308 family) [Propionibacteriaceae bacterium ES.041]|uniref:HdeD family acid-resistance protein n=1 Tax=Enemella evansiae TaxID=2016499 RepID=A0A255GLN2_9ACTN|nr:DUF308 domain-containing protein [Enemella evansiae]OYO02162.1 hypothetical protein CGZ95_06500 [Enemella evansiae]OYO16748.1 hypothetical protein CGZ94_03705 [Enemella evansiae]PFG65749.1 uncharacterized membrane protein HdeD (DUF308 family) [Propionibacteriaceae bacterium ES.041]
MLTLRTSTSLIISGILAILFGILASIWPATAILTLVLIWGAYALIDGIIMLVLAFRRGASGAGRVFLIIAGVIGVLAGLIALIRPFQSAVALTWVLGIWLMVRGIMEIISAFSAGRGGRRWLLVLGGVLWLLAGILFAANPGAAAVGISLWIGIMAIIWGVLLVIGGIQLRSALKQENSRNLS